MNTLQVTCKPIGRDEVFEVTALHTKSQECWTDKTYTKDQLFNYSELDWIDFGTTRWYPYGK